MPRSIRLWGLVRASLIMVAALGALSYVDVSVRQRDGGRLSAVIFDPLYADDPGLHAEMANLLAAHGYTVDSVTGEKATPGALMRLGHRDVMVLRVHSTCNLGEVWFFTGEEYSQDRYVLEQIADEVHKARPSLGSRHVFAVGSSFVRRFMAGSLRGTIVLLMGCDRLRSEDLATAFTECGAAAYVSWDGPVSLPDTDWAFLGLLETLAAQSMTLGDAVAHANGLVGQDPDYNSTLRLKPDESARVGAGRGAG